MGYEDEVMPQTVSAISKTLNQEWEASKEKRAKTAIQLSLHHSKSEFYKICLVMDPHHCYSAAAVKWSIFLNTFVPKNVQKCSLQNNTYTITLACCTVGGAVVPEVTHTHHLQLGWPLTGATGGLLSLTGRFSKLSMRVLFVHRHLPL